MRYAEILLNRLIPMIELDGLSDEYDGQFVKRELFVHGRTGVTDTLSTGEKLEKPMFWRGFCGGEVTENFIGSRFIGSSPVLGSCDFEIGTGGAVIYNSTSDKYSPFVSDGIVIGTKNRRSTDPIVISNADVLPFSSLYEFILRTAEQLENIDISLRSILRTLRAMIFVVAKNEQIKNAAEILLKKLYNGETDIVFTSDILDSLQIQFAPTAANAASILNELKEQYQFANAQFFHAIGVNSNYNLKRERLNSAEIDLNEQALCVNIQDIFDSWKRGFDDVAKLYPSIKVTPKLSDVWAQNEPKENDTGDSANNAENDKTKGGESSVNDADKVE